MKKIFLLGSERSGSNLLRTLLGNHSKISAPIAPNFCNVFINNLNLYKAGGDFKKAMLLKDMELYVNHPFNRWNIKIDPKRAIEKYNPSTLFHFIDLFFTEKAIQDGKHAYFSKDNHNHKYALGILKNIPEAKFIYLYRDPRDHVASWLRSPFHLHSAYKAIAKWVNEQKECLHLYNFYGVDMCFLKYEDLVDNVEAEMIKVLNFIELPLETACFVTNKSNQEVEINPLWKNINKPIIKNNYGKYKDVLSGEDIKMIETIGKKEMEILGYDLHSKADWKKGNEFIFKMKQKWIEFRSRKKHKMFHEEMKNLIEKQAYIKSLFTKYKV